MDDLDLDRELQAAFAVEPSPEFVARVRTTIAETPSPSTPARLLKPAAAIACAVLVAIVIGLPREDARLEPRRTEIMSRPAEDASVTAGLKPGTTNVQLVPAVVVPTFRSAKPISSAQQPSAGTNETPLPEVIIAADDVEAVRQFVSGARDLRFVASFEETPAPVPWAMNDLAVPPITIEPLDSAPAHNN